MKAHNFVFILMLFISWLAVTVGLWDSEKAMKLCPFLGHYAGGVFYIVTVIVVMFGFPLFVRLMTGKDGGIEEHYS